MKKYITTGLIVILLSTTGYLLYDKFSKGKPIQPVIASVESKEATPSSTTDIVKETREEKPVRPDEEIRKRLFELTDEQIQAAIDRGKIDTKKYTEFENAFELPTITNKLSKIYLPRGVKIATPTYLVTASSFLNNATYKPYSIADAKHSIDSDNKLLVFVLNIFGDSLTFPKDANIVMKQGDTIIQSSNIIGKNNSGNVTEHFPNSPVYQAMIMPCFPQDQIDFSKEATLIYMFPDKDHAVHYKIDFSKYQ
ncbi:hypothetical protein EEL31_10545 [Brevibacillus laterosporus]|nr:hypothetical protein [Brevibacillus laterosporus]TPG68924.1 hypothetical protein EEL31_10545 [Brevibacillus laterosporus]